MYPFPTKLLLPLLILLTTLLGPAPAAYAAGIQYGFNAWTPTYGADATLNRQKALGNVPVRRMFVYWFEVQPSGPNDWKWDTFDRVYRSIVSAGLKPHLVLHGTPCWANTSVTCVDGRFAGALPSSRSDAQWKQFVTKVVGRYPAASLDLWNEANVGTPPADAKRYAELLKLTYPIVKRANPGMQVVSTGLSINHPTQGNWETFLRTMLANGAGRSLDAIGLHTYPVDITRPPSLYWSADQFEPILDAVNRVQAEFGLHKPLWILEAGCGSTIDNSFFRSTTVDQQSSDCLAMMSAAERRGDVRAMYFHTLDDAPPAMNYGWTGGFGMYDADGLPKPAACAMSARLGGQLRC